MRIFLKNDLFKIRTMILLLFMMCCIQWVTARDALDVTQQERTVRGRVVDNNGESLPGASVMIKATTTGTTTDANGNYVLNLGNVSNPVLVVSFIGYNPSEMEVGNQIVLNFTLTESAEQIEEVVVSGYFNRRKDSFTGSAIIVTGEELKRLNPNNVLQSIENFDPSFKILQNNIMGSNPNQLPSINVRGVASLPTGVDSEVLRRDNIASAVNLPTFILDGYEVSLEKIYDLDANRIESITLLKDAAATAIYGSRASNGVLVITTVTPKEGDIQVFYNYELNASFADLTSYNVLNAREKLEYERLAGVYETSGISLEDQEELYYQKLFNVLSGVNTYWLAQPVRNTLGNKHSLSIGGGSKSIRYGIDGQFQTAPGVMKKSGRDRYGLGMDLSYNFNGKLLFKNRLSFTEVTGHDSPYGNFSEYVRMNPYYPKTDSRGQFVQEIDSWTDRSGAGNDTRTEIVLNPLYNATLASFYTSKYREISDAFITEWNITEGLKFRGLFSILQKNSTDDYYTSPFHNEFFDYEPENISKRGRYIYSGGESTFVDGNATLTYNKKVKEHFFNTALGVNVRTGNTINKSFRAIGFTNDRFTDIGFARGYDDNSSPSSQVERDRLFGSFFSFNYSFKERYLIDASIRADGSSKFGSNKKVAPFWAMGIGWNLHHEEFIKQLKFINQFRITANMGLTGSVSFSPFMANTLYQYNKDNWYSTGVGAFVSQYGNKDLQWQQTVNRDLGLNLGLWDDRLNVSARLYHRLTENMLTDISLPPSTGFASYRDNLGDIKNTGYELIMRVVVFKNTDWNVALNGNFVHNQNKLVKISNALKKHNEKVDETQVNTNSESFGLPLLRYMEGQSINTIYAVQSMGIDPENGKEIFVKTDGTLNYNWDVKDIVPICDATPKLDGFFGGTVYYKGLMLNFSFYTRFGGYEYNQTLLEKIENANPRYNVDQRALDHRWVQPGDKALYKNIRDESRTNVTERFIQKDNFLELRSVYLSYEWKQDFMKKIGMKNLRTAISANNLWQTSSIAIERGIYYPFARSFTFSIQTSFN